MMVQCRHLFVAVAVLLCCSFISQANASTVTTTGSFAADNSEYIYSFTSTSPQDYAFDTTSFASGGFVPVLTLFTAAGQNIGTDGGDGPCISAATCMDDAHLNEVLDPGSYLLYLTEFPNTPDGSGLLSAGFLFESDPNATGTVCGVAGGQFLQSDLSPCVQRTNQFAVSVSSTAVTPEPPSWLLCLPPLLLFAYARRRQLL